MSMRKERYFTPEFIEKMEQKYFREDKLKLSESKIIVLGIDMQRHFLEKGMKAFLPSSEEFLGVIEKFYKSVKDLGIDIILTRHCHENNNLARWWKDSMRCEDDSTEVIPRIRRYGSVIIEKNTYDPFIGTDIERILNEREIRTVIITGVMTHLCCETAARSAFNRGYNVIFPVDGTLTQNSALHECSLRSLSHGFAAVPSLNTLVKFLWKQE